MITQHHCQCQLHHQEQLLPIKSSRKKNREKVIKPQSQPAQHPHVRDLTEQEQMIPKQHESMALAMACIHESPNQFYKFTSMCIYVCRHANNCWKPNLGPNQKKIKWMILAVKIDKQKGTRYKFHQLGTILTEIDQRRTWVCFKIDQTKIVCPKNLTKISTEERIIPVDSTEAL